MKAKELKVILQSKYDALLEQEKILSGSDNPQTREAYLLVKGRLMAFQDVLEALGGNPVRLKI